jgi:glycosyltransferase involved in cell wall biosynthesis
MNSTPQRVLMLIPSYVKHGIDEAVAADAHPRMDYHQLACELKARGCNVDMLDYSALRAPGLGLKDARLALLGFGARRRYDAIFCNSESIALPLGALLRRDSRRPRVVAIGHRISSKKKRFFFTKLRALDGIDTLFLYATAQLRYATRSLGLPPQKTPLIAFHADCKFFRPIDAISSVPRQRMKVGAAGLEWRDYPTLIDVAERMPDTDFYLAAASPWSKHKNETDRAGLPPNVSVGRLDYNALRTMYLTSDCVAVPLYETDFQAGVTTILEAMACARPVITSSTTGQTDVVRDGETGAVVPPGDSRALEDALRDLLAGADRRARLSAAGRRWVESNASLEQWAENLVMAIVTS